VALHFRIPPGLHINSHTPRESEPLDSRGLRCASRRSGLPSRNGICAASRP
jgi:hypothetical protein